MITLAFPFSAPVVFIELRNPSFQDSESFDNNVKIQVAMSGALYSRHFTGALTKLRWTFNDLTRPKATELLTFIEGAGAEFVRLIDFEGTSWKVRFTENVENTTESLGLGPSNVRKEANSVTVEMEGVKL